MKHFILIILSVLICNSAFAQNLKVVSTYPEKGATAVETDSIIIEFNKAVFVNTEVENPFEFGFNFSLLPEDSTEFDSLSVNEDGTAVTMYGTLKANTDFVAIMEYAQDLNGNPLESPYVFQFTTAPEAGQYVVTGYLETPNEAPLKINSADSYNGVIITLSDSRFNLSSEMGCMDEICEEQDNTPIYAANVDTTTGYFEISGVREGNYFPMGFNVLDHGDFESLEDFVIPDIYILDEDSDLIADSIQVNSSTAPDDTLRNVFLEKLTINSYTFFDALEEAFSVLEQLPNSPEFIGGFTFYTYVPFEQIFKNKSPQTDATGLTQTPVFEENDFFDVFSEPDGSNFSWEIIAYDDVKDSVVSINVTPFGAEFSEYIGEEEAELPENVNFSDIKPLPEDFIDSDSAFTVFEANGGSDFRNEFSISGSESGSYGYWYLDMTAVHEFWEYEPDPTPNAPVMWIGRYSGYLYNAFEQESIEAELNIFLDLQTGAVLDIQEKRDTLGGQQESHLTFKEAVAILEEELDSEFPNQPEIAGGTTNYSYYPFPAKSAKVTPTKPAGLFKRPENALANEFNESLNPDGHNYVWNIFAYDAVKDSAMTFMVDPYGWDFIGYQSEEEIEGDLEFDDIKLLPEEFIDSDSAAVLFDNAGAEDFRHSLANSEMGWSWEMEMQILHNYWEFPPDPTPTAPVTWRAIYRAYAYDEVNQETIEDSLAIFLDAVTGEVVYSQIPVNNEVDESPERFTLHQNYPNPFNPSTNITFTLSEASLVSIDIYNILGQKVATLTNKLYSAGNHALRWDASGLSSGVYIYRMSTQGFTQTRKLMLMK